MARQYARVKVGIWGDLDFRALTADAQHLYFVLLTSPKLNLAGVADWRPARLAALAKGWTSAKVREFGEELQEARFVVLDEDTEEVLIRSFVRHDGVLQGPKTAAGMAKDYAGISSQQIMLAVASEVARAADEDPDLKGLSVLEDIIEQGVADTPSRGTLPVSDDQTDTQSDASSREDGGSIPIPHPSTLNQQPRREGRSTRIDPDFEMTDSLRSWAKEKGYDFLDLKAITEDFVDYWIAKGGKDATKTDWSRTWQRWIREEVKRARPHLRVAGGSPKPESTPKHLIPNCPTCGAPQAIVHYDECPDQEWRPGT